MQGMECKGLFVYKMKLWVLKHVLIIAALSSFLEVD